MTSGPYYFSYLIESVIMDSSTLPFQHGYKIECIESLFLDTSILKSGEPHHPLSVAVVHWDDHDTSGFQLFNEFFGNAWCTRSYQDTIEWAVCGKSLKSISEEEAH